MRITKIKLAGFKSFVDPTTLTLPGNLTGVVGPNGCGKSNIIDALQWVMGESSAKQMRGDSMADVIFNGSNSRKPVGQASVELVFDNSDGTLGGQYAGYGEISIKRTISRDGVSVYLLNGARCRRKDVTDVFLGTGLGVRGGYSVIEQGMISRVVEAKPEELRGFLEEAAGISKYKERRRETENRIKHARENIERLDDIREEIAKQLTHLQRQANAAERYQVLKHEERLTEAQLLALRWRTIESTRAIQAAHVGEVQNSVEAAIANLRAIESDQVSKRDGHLRATDEFNKIQSDFYARSAEISRLEQALQHSEERKQSLTQDLERARAGLDEINTLVDSDRGTIESIDEQLLALEPDVEHQNAAAEQANATLKASEERAESWQQQWDDFNSERAEVARLEHAEQIRLEHLHESISGAKSKIDGLSSERQQTVTEELEATINESRAETLIGEQAQDELLLQRDSVKTQLQDARHRTVRCAGELHELRTELQTLSGKEASLNALQHAALRQDQGELDAWLAQFGLDDSGLLAERISIERGWETAVEAAMKIPLSAICQDRSIERILAADLSGLPTAVATFVERSANPHSLFSDPNKPKLLDKVRSDWPVDALLAGVYIADSVAQAREMSAGLAAHESVITRDGYWIGPNWIQIRGDVQEEGGILQRERSLEEIRTRTGQLHGELTDAQDAYDRARRDVDSNEQRDAQIAEQLQQCLNSIAKLRADLSHQEATLERKRERVSDITNEINVLEQQSVGGESAAAAALATLQSIRQQLSKFDSRKAELLTVRAEMQEHLDKARTMWRDAREARHCTALKLESLRASKESLSVALSRNTLQCNELVARCADLNSAIASATEPQNDLRVQLDDALGARIGLENGLADARKTLETFELDIRQNDEMRMKSEQEVEQLRGKLDQVRLEERAIQVRQQALEERITQSEFTITALLEELNDEASDTTWQERLDLVCKRIERLGPINLAAIDEFSQLSQRKEYLDSQHADLTEALETLEGAIRKIDRETRTRFKETFDKVNIGIQTMFPTLFGGGHAYLELTDDDLLETGVTVMARPPGKRNSTIHLLSGGEKALTALAFVFSLFELNPAPFCLLDEVDAPLDDANVVRLSKMLKTMSQTVQFICVTHNKITMEISEQLVGVTMQEAGVSRLVSVNMEEAVEMVAAS
ncbi:MAG: chromosome segregation protein SMC [Proteobacteria bacterium]|nr:chromosome segregation protein SMC [Pseudomonadota bacterium]